MKNPQGTLNVVKQRLRGYGQQTYDKVMTNPYLMEIQAASDIYVAEVDAINDKYEQKQITEAEGKNLVKEARERYHKKLYEIGEKHSINPKKIMKLIKKGGKK